MSYYLLTADNHFNMSSVRNSTNNSDQIYNGKQRHSFTKLVNKPPTAASSMNGGSTVSMNGKMSRASSNGRISPGSNHSSAATGHKPESSINQKTVERIDSGVKEILKTVSCVVVYEYLEESESWVRYYNTPH